jgi:hypothetical protein
LPGTRSATPDLLLTAVWTGMGLLLWVMFPMTAAVLLPLCAIAPLAWCWVARRRLSWSAFSPVILALALAAGYLLVNASWSLSPASALRAVALLFIMTAVLHVAVNALPELDEGPLRAMAAGALVGVTVGGALLCLEVLSDQSLRRFLIGLVPALQPSASHVLVEGGSLVRLAPYLPNASISVLTLMFWPAALLAHRLAPMYARGYRNGALITAAIVAATVFASEHATSQMAFVGAGATFLLFRVRPKLAMPLVLAAWMAANLLVVPAATALYYAEAYRAAWLPESARHRVVIWRHTSEQVPKAPLLGAGMGSARALHAAGAAEGPVAPGTQFHLTTSLHSHNAYLQVWFETGAVGVLIMLALGLLILRALARLRADMQPYLAAAFVCGALLIASAYSIWAPWFMASLAMASIFALLGIALPESRGGCVSASPAGALAGKSIPREAR